jgi:hypothetical protein
MGYVIYFLTRETVELVINLGHHWIRVVSSLEMTVSVLCLTFWIMTLRREGETRRAVVGHQWNPADEQRLRAQLDAINASLLRSNGK